MNRIHTRLVSLITIVALLVDRGLAQGEPPTGPAEAASRSASESEEGSLEAVLLILEPDWSKSESAKEIEADLATALKDRPIADRLRKPRRDFDGYMGMDEEDASGDSPYRLARFGPRILFPDHSASIYGPDDFDALMAWLQKHKLVKLVRKGEALRIAPFPGAPEQVDPLRSAFSFGGDVIPIPPSNRPAKPEDVFVERKARWVSRFSRAGNRVSGDRFLSHVEERRGSAISAETAATAAIRKRITFDLPDDRVVVVSWFPPGEPFDKPWRDYARKQGIEAVVLIRDPATRLSSLDEPDSKLTPELRIAEGFLPVAASPDLQASEVVRASSADSQPLAGESVKRDPALPDGIRSIPDRNAREVVEAYVAAALAGKVADAAALATAGTAAESKEQIEEFRKTLGGTKPVVIADVLADDKQNEALAVSGQVKLAEPDPDGQDTGRLVFLLNRSSGKWSISDIDLESRTNADKEIQAFKKKHPNATEIPSGRISIELRIAPDTPQESIVDIVQKLQGLKIHSVTLFASEPQTTGILAVIKAPQNVPYQEVTEIIASLGETGVQKIAFAAPAEREPAKDDGAPEASKAGKSSGELTVFYFKHADAQSAFTILSQLFRDFTVGPDGLFESMAVDPRLNAILVRGGSQEELSELETVVKQLDQPHPGQPIDPYSAEAPPTTLAEELMSAQSQLTKLGDKYKQLEQQAARLAEQHRHLSTKATRTPGDAEALKQQLAGVVKQAFVARQQLQRAELAQFRQRLSRIEQQIATRDRIEDKIIDRRVEELLNPDVRWELDRETTAARSRAAPTSAKDSATGGAAVTQSLSPAVVTQSGDYSPLAEDPGLMASEMLAQVSFRAPQGTQVTCQPVGADESVIQLPAEFDVSTGTTLPFRLSDIPNHAGLELAGTIEIAPISAQAKTYLQHNAIPIAVTNEDLDQAASGNLVTKVIYLPRPEDQELAVVGTESVVSTRLDPGVNPVTAAERRGHVLAILRLGNRVRLNRDTRVHSAYAPETVRLLETQLNSLLQTLSKTHPKVRALESQLLAARGYLSESMTAPSYILRSASEFERKLSEAEAGLKHVMQLEKKGYAAADAVESSRRQLTVMRGEYAAQLRLLELELQQAESTADAATKGYERLRPLYRSSTTPELVDAGREADIARLRAERLKTLLELYRKVDLTDQPHLKPVDEEDRTESLELENPAKLIWDMLGVKLRPLSRDSLSNTRYRGGMQVTEIRKGEPAAKATLRVDDILVGIHHWETKSLQDIHFALNHSDVQPTAQSPKEVKAYVLRGAETLFAVLSLRAPEKQQAEAD